MRYVNTAPLHKCKSGSSVIVLDGPVVSAASVSGRSDRGEVDTYHFDVATRATHIMTTEGPSDTVLTLHGPNDSGAVLAWDDDRGKGRNARIVRKLPPGSYWLSVRHKVPGGSGAYNIVVKKTGN